MRSDAEEYIYRDAVKFATDLVDDGTVTSWRSVSEDIHDQSPDVVLDGEWKKLSDPDWDGRAMRPMSYFVFHGSVLNYKATNSADRPRHWLPSFDRFPSRLPSHAPTHKLIQSFLIFLIASTMHSNVAVIALIAASAASSAIAAPLQRKLDERFNPGEFADAFQSIINNSVAAANAAVHARATAPAIRRDLTPEQALASLTLASTSAAPSSKRELAERFNPDEFANAFQAINNNLIAAANAAAAAGPSRRELAERFDPDEFANAFQSIINNSVAAANAAVHARAIASATRRNVTPEQALASLILASRSFDELD
ncbi:hypothetical protein FA95DRAFT_1612633 [Auriscalpium vulgare]|uniref:Uncharacterized protein n=1 Tax=Auriscalpium vulgare TaxID=40419 RepID=A0ACB8R5I5_9AGAM|nr:hypothetical protein FA95DRAFT_1612633 [Auriscalpium vulgare]